MTRRSHRRQAPWMDSCGSRQEGCKATYRQRRFENNNMIRYLKKGIAAGQQSERDARVQSAVESILSDIGDRGDEAVRRYSQQFDGWSPDSFRLSREEIDACHGRLDPQDIADIRFAQEQIRNFARIQLEALNDVEVETRPGVVLGHRNIPVASVGCYVPGGKYPLVASAHMSIVTARVAGVERVLAASPPFEGAPNPAVVVAMDLAGADEIYCLGGCSGHRRHGFGDRHDFLRRYDRRSGQCLCGRGQAAAVRPGGHRPAGRPH